LLTLYFRKANQANGKQIFRRHHSRQWNGWH